MTPKFTQEYRNPEISRRIVEQIKEVSKKDIRLMEVCGTHTTSIFRHGIPALLPDNIRLISGPGCPVCVTTQSEIDAFIELSRADDRIVATFGDLLRVPGTSSSLQWEKAEGRDIRVVYSPSDALEMASRNPDKKVVLIAVGFETTAPTVAASIITARERKIRNYFVFSAHKLVPPALVALMEAFVVKIDGFVLPGHVSVIIGEKAYQALFQKYNIPCAIAGFEPVDILQALFVLVRQIEVGRPAVQNCYQRAVTLEGNQKAQKIMEDVFDVVDVEWRGLGKITNSGLKIRKDYASFDAQKAFNISLPSSKNVKGCACGDILTGRKTPPECPLYKKACTPMDPVGPCMVSSEGTCAAYYSYHHH
jgi:hydrogenase expression/formation protein HypD